MYKHKLLIPAAVICFLFCGCREYSASMEKVRSLYDSSAYEYILNYEGPDGFHSVCLEEEFDLAEGEIKGFQVRKRLFGISFILDTQKEWFYILNLNCDGSLVLHRIDFRN